MHASEIIRTATELFEHGYHSSVAAVCMDALAEHPDDVEIRVLLARALVALRQDERAQRELSEILRRDGNSSMAFQLLGELAYRRDDLPSAEIYFRESWRLDPGNASARIWLDVTLTATRAADPVPVSGIDDRGQLVLPRPASRRRFARGTAPNLHAFHDQKGGRGRPRTSGPDQGTVRMRAPGRRDPAPRPERMSARPVERAHDDGVNPSRFGGYLVGIGVLTEQELALALAYQRDHGVRVGDAAVALGYLQPQKLNWAALAFHCRRPD